MKHNQCPKAQSILQTETASVEETFCQSPEDSGMFLILLSYSEEKDASMWHFSEYLAIYSNTVIGQFDCVYKLTSHNELIYSVSF